MSKGDFFIQKVKALFSFLVDDNDFKVLNDVLTPNIFYKVSYSDSKIVVSISYEDFTENLNILIYQLADGIESDYDDRTKTRSLNTLNRLVLPKLGKDDHLENSKYFKGIACDSKLERELLKRAKELRLCFLHSSEWR